MLLDAAVPPRSPSYQAFISCIQYLGQGSEGGGGGGIYLHVKKSFEKWELERDQIKRRKEEEIKNYSSEIF